MLLPKETEVKANGSEQGGELDTSAAAEILDEQQIDDEVVDINALTDVAAVNSNDNLLDESQQHVVIPTEDSPKFDQYLLDSLTAAVTSTSSTSITSGGFLSNYSNAGNSQNSNSDNHNEMPQLLNILNELLDGQDLTSLANSGGNGDIVDHENFDDDSPRKDDPDEIAKQLAQQRLEVISREEQQLQRRMDFLIRRLYKLVARSTGLHVSEEIAGFLEHVARFSKKKEKEKSLAATKFPYLAANLQGTSAELLKSPPSVTQEPPLNLLSSPSTQDKNEKEKDSAAPAVVEEIVLDVAVKQEQPDVIEPTKTDSLKPVPISEMKSFLRRIENISTMQSTALNKRGLAFKYFTKFSSQNLNQSSSSSKSHHIHTHPHQESSSSSGINNFKVSAIPKFEDADVEQVEQTSGLLMTEMRLIENQVDSDATASSTGGESADEMVAYNNTYQQPLSISKRAAYKYAKDRGAVASRWCWLATQISELDYKIRQLTDLRKHVRDTKGSVILESVGGFEGQLPGNNSYVYNLDSESDEGDGNSSARTRPYLPSSFRKRKLVQIANLHQISKKAARPSTLKCTCNWPIQPCALCTGRTDPTQPRECNDVLPETERVALLDPTFHPVLSFPEDVSSTIHLEALCNIPEWQSKMIRSSPKSIMKHAIKYLESLESNGRYKEENKPFGIARPYAIEGGEKKMKKGNIDMLTGKRKYTKRLFKMDPSLANKLKDRKKYKKRNASLAMAGAHIPRKYTFKKRIPRGDELPNNGKINGLNGTDKNYDPFVRSKNSSPVPNAKEKTSESRRARNYDIDNIVIPYSVAAATRIELLSYKEIPTPKWRIVPEEEELEQLIVEEEKCLEVGELVEEDVSEGTMVVIHEKAQMDERKKFETYLKFPLTSRSRANRRTDSRGNESSGANTPTPDASSPAPHQQGDSESIPSPLDGPMLHDTPSITAILNNFNGRKDRKRTISKKDEVHDGGGSKSGSASRCISPDFKEIVPAYEPLTFPLTETSFTRMKREMPVSTRKAKSNSNNTSENNEKFFVPLETSASQQQSQQLHSNKQQSAVKLPPGKKRKHNDSISESILIKEKLPSLAAIGRNNNILIPRKNNHNILDNIDLTGADGATLKKLMNNNNGDLMNGGGSDSDDNLMDDNSDSETVTGDESLYEPEESPEEETDSDPEEEYLDDENDEDYDEKIYSSTTKKKNSSSILDCHY